MEGWFESLTVGASKERNVPNARVATNLFADPWTSRLPYFRSGRLARKTHKKASKAAPFCCK